VLEGAFEVFVRDGWRTVAAGESASAPVGERGNRVVPGLPCPGANALPPSREKSVSAARRPLPSWTRSGASLPMNVLAEFARSGSARSSG
jgi:hypothetical protein